MSRSLAHLLARLMHLLRTQGVGGLLRKLYARAAGCERQYRARKLLEDLAFDEQGYETGGIQHIFGMTLSDERKVAAGGHHVATPPDAFSHALASLDIVCTGVTFIDLGSGKGRAILLAADLPFAKVIGVEFAEELHNIALANLAQRASRVGIDPRLMLIHGDATRFIFPEEPTVLFLYNPFDPPVLTSVVERTLASWRASPRPFRVIYLNPVHSEAWTSLGWRCVITAPGLAIYAPPAG